MGDKAWSKTLGQKWGRSPTRGLWQHRQFASGPVLTWYRQTSLKGAKTSSEKVNGVQTTRYSFDKEARWPRW